VTVVTAAKPLKRLKTAMGSYSFGATSAYVWRHIRLVWRHVRLGSAPRRHNRYRSTRSMILIALSTCAFHVMG
jgi:hypothetical protein